MILCSRFHLVFMYVLLIYLCIGIHYLAVINAIPLHELHKAIATDPEELLQHFESKSAETVPEYEVIPVLPHRTRRDVSSNKKEYRLSAFGEDFHLELEPIDDVVSPTLVVMTAKRRNTWTKNLYKPEGQFYQGHVISDPNSHVAVRELQRPGEMTGGIFSGEHVYRLHPLSDTVKKKMSLQRHQGYHVITRRSLKHTRNPGFFPEPIKVQHQSEELIHPNRQRSRTRRDLGPKYIEAMLTLDKISSDYYGNTSMDFVLAVANLVNRFYHDKSIGIDVTWTLTKVFIIETDLEALNFQKQNINSAVKYVEKFAAWATPQNAESGQPEHFDNGVLLSRDICGLADCGTLGGVAFSGVPCSTTRGYTVNNANGIDVAFYVAHEMGHNFGIPHDSGACNNGYMMSPGQAGGPNAFQWSTCSSEMFKSVFGRVTCYNNKPPKEIELPHLPPGHNYDANYQCRILHGPEYKECPVTQNSCSLLFCYKSGGCSSSGTPPVDGTSCGKRKWCVGGHCVDVGTSLPPALDGGWGSWGAYSSCSRTCGGGVRSRMRLCNKPSPQFGGKTCPGSNIGEWNICEKANCPGGSDHYRLYQCKQKNKDFKYYTIRSDAVCYLACSKDGRAFSVEGRVADGTQISNDPLVDDICIQAKRVEVGCDQVINSGSKRDRCVKCLQDGSSCVRVHGVYTDIGQPNGIKNAVPIITVPAGSSDFSIKENTATTNLLNLKSNNKLIFPNWPQTSTRSAAGTTITYWSSSTKILATESMTFPGPTTDALVPMFVNVLNEKNEGYTYNFYKPGKGASTTYFWKAVPYGTCNAPCAKGSKPQTVKCVRKDDESEISRKFCDLGNQPDVTIPCNTDPCKAKWVPELWSQCSHRCGGGNKTRLVPCVQKVTPTIYRNVEYSLCEGNQTRPPRIETCNKIECGAAWKLGDWSVCNDGKATRNRKCINIMADGTVIDLADDRCNINLVSPQLIKNCTMPASGNYIRPCAFTLFFISSLITFFPLQVVV